MLRHGVFFFFGRYDLENCVYSMIPCTRKEQAKWNWINVLLKGDEYPHKNGGMSEVSW